MADVNLDIVKTFFEKNGFFVKTGGCLFVKNPLPDEKKESGFLLNAENIKELHNAVVEVRTWHSEALFPSRISGYTEIFRFLGKNMLEEAARELGTGDFKKVLVVSKLPSSKKTSARSIQILKSGGIDFVIQFPEILRFLINKVRVNVNYTENDVLQVLRILKACGFFGPGQLELF